MPIQIEPPREDHGVMPWTGDFDEDGRAIFECPQCGASVALGGPARPTYKRLHQGDFYARHSAYTTLEIMRAALDLEIWQQAPGNREFLEQWETEGGGPLFGIDGVSIQKKPPD